MEHCPTFTLFASMFTVPTLIVMSQAINKFVVRELHGYSNIFSSTLVKHLLSEVEVSLVSGELTSESRLVMARLGYEQEVLQYTDQLRKILLRWSDLVLGQPVQPEVHNFVFECKQKTFELFEKYIVKVQNYAFMKRCLEDKKLATKVCNMQSRVINMTRFEISSDLIALLNNGPNFVPNICLGPRAVEDLVKSDLRKAAISTFYHLQGYYPHVSSSNSLESLIIELCSQSPSNSNLVSFYYSLNEKYKDLISNLKTSILPAQFKDVSFIGKIPKGSVLTTADKGLGFVLLPIEWYIEQYKVQAVKGRHLKTSLTNERCLRILETEIQAFRQSLDAKEGLVFKETFKKAFSKKAVGVLKLLPKIHKVKCLSPETWREVPSRPIRGAENCPLNSYSKALCKLLQQLLDKLRNHMGSRFPVIKVWLLVR